MPSFFEKHVYVLRHFLNFWTFLFFAVFLFDFYTMGSYSDYLPPIAATYMGVLAIYVGTKEFERWEHNRLRYHIGETFVILWTILMFSIMVFNLFLDRGYKIPPEIIATYIGVLSVFAITRESKMLFKRKREIIKEHDEEHGHRGIHDH